MANTKNIWENPISEWELDAELNEELNTPDIGDPSGEELVADPDAVAAAKTAVKKQAIKTGAIAVGSVLVGSLIIGNMVRGMIKKKKDENIEGEDGELEEVGVTDPDGQTVHTVGNDPDAPTSVMRDESDGSELDVAKIKPEGKDAEEQARDAIRKMADQMGIDPDDKTLHNIAKAAWDLSARVANDTAADDINELAKKAESQAKGLKTDLNKKVEELAAQTKRADAQAKRAKEAEDEVAKLRDELKKLKAAEEARAAAEVKAAEIAADEAEPAKEEDGKDEEKEVKAETASADDEIDEERAAALAAKMREKKGGKKNKGKKNNK